MSLEQKENDEFFQKKKEKKEHDRSQEFFKQRKIKLESARLLKKLSSEIAQEFGLDQIEVQSLIESQTHGDLDQLQQSFTKEKKNLLAERIKQAGERIESLSKKHRELLKKSLEEDILDPETHTYHVGKHVFGEHIYARVQNPQHVGDHIVGVGLGLVDSTEAVIFFLYELGKGILMTPYHMYLLMRGKAEYKGKGNIL